MTLNAACLPWPITPPAPVPVSRYSAASDAVSNAMVAASYPRYVRASWGLPERCEKRVEMTLPVELVEQANALCLILGVEPFPVPAAPVFYHTPVGVSIVPAHQPARSWVQQTRAACRPSFGIAHDLLERIALADADALDGAMTTDRPRRAAVMARRRAASWERAMAA